MSKKRKKKRRKKRRRRGRAALSPETRTAEALTVFWMLTMLASLLAQAGVVAAGVYMLLVARSEPVYHLWGLLLFIAAITGGLSLAALPLVRKYRRRRPPWAITIFAAMAGAAPIATLLLLWLIRQWSAAPPGVDAGGKTRHEQHGFEHRSSK